MDAQLRTGHPDVEGLCRALVDWSAELRLIEREGRGKDATPARSQVALVVTERKPSVQGGP